MTFFLCKSIAVSSVNSTTVIVEQWQYDIVAAIRGTFPGRYELEEKTLGRIQSVLNNPEDGRFFKAHFCEYSRTLLTVLGADYFKLLDCQVKEKVLDVVTSKLLELLQDKEVPDSIKQLTIERMGNMARDLASMTTRPTQTLLLDTNNKSMYPSYEASAKKLKAALIGLRSSAGVTFNPRSIKLFAWCREQLSRTAHPIVGYFSDHDQFPNLKSKLEKLWDVCNLIIFQIVCGDDVSDNIQDETVTLLFSEIPCLSPEDILSKQAQLTTYRDGIFLDFFNQAVVIWNESKTQLEQLFGGHYFNQHVKDEFLLIYNQIMQSLTYSLSVNINPHDQSINLDTLNTKLAPNIAVECFRYLERKLVEQYANDVGMPLPEVSDLEVAAELIRNTEKSAFKANAAATAPRERRENDLSSPFPFEMNRLFRATLKQNESFKDIFEQFLNSKQYKNHFLETYYENLPPNFDYLSLLVVRRKAVTTIVEQLEKMRQNGHQIPDTDYEMDTLGQRALELPTANLSADMQMDLTWLKKFRWHVKLIDEFSDQIAIQTRVQDVFFENWQTELDSTVATAKAINDRRFQQSAVDYIESWKNFLCMYLLFKRALDGTV